MESKGLYFGKPKRVGFEKAAYALTIVFGIFLISITAAKIYGYSVSVPLPPILSEYQIWNDAVARWNNNSPVYRGLGGFVLSVEFYGTFFSLIFASVSVRRKVIVTWSQHITWKIIIIIFLVSIAIIPQFYFSSSGGNEPKGMEDIDPIPGFIYNTFFGIGLGVYIKMWLSMILPSCLRMAVFKLKRNCGQSKLSSGENSKDGQSEETH